MTHEYNNKASITIPLKTGGESLFLGTPGSNPGPLTMFSYNDHFADGNFPSFSELLMGSATATATSSGLTLVPDHNNNNNNYNNNNNNWGGDIDTGRDDGSGFKQKRPGNLVLPVHVSPVFNISPVFSPSAFITSPTFFPPSLSPYGMSPQQTLAQLTAQAHAALSSNHAAEYNPQPQAAYTNPVFNSTQIRQPQAVDPPITAPQTDKRPPNFPINVAKPVDDGYNWRKYGQKQVKGSEYPRSYYRCTSSSCPVKKKVERSFNGCITEIIYKGQHNHERPQGRRGSNTNKDGLGSEGQSSNFNWSGRDSDPSTQATCMMLHGPSDSEESGENYQNEHEDDDDNDEPNAKRRNGGAGQSDGPFTHRTMTEPKIVVQTRSEVDLLDDGYRWRKYGQKVVKGNPNPRSYYKCTTEGCKVRKHVERASTDVRAVITTYEGKHIHDVPAPRGSSSINAATYEPQQLRLNNSAAHMDFGIKNQNPVSLRLKQEHNLG